MVKLMSILKEVNNDHKQAEVEHYNATHIDEINLKKAAAIGAMGLASLGSPTQSSGQSTFLQKLKDRVVPKTSQVDTVKVQKGDNLQLAKFKDYEGIGYGHATSPDQSMAMKQAKMRAVSDWMRKEKVQTLTGGVEEKTTKLYKKEDGTYEAEVIVSITKTKNK